jgi:formylglycine-generating enzyme required for sulfatase activity
VLRTGCALVASLLLLWATSSTAAEPAPAGRAPLLKTFVEEFVPITPGEGKFPKSFLMGSADGPESERPAHEVSFDYTFAMAKYEVPQNLYAAVMGENPSRWKGPRNSAEMFRIAEAEEFCTRVTKFLRDARMIGDDEVIRLPSEAEWEYCCRAGTKTAYSFGDQATAEEDTGNKATVLGAYGWHTGNAAGNDPPVGKLKPNAWGLYDMHGYLWEFVADGWHPDYKGSPTDGSAWTAGDKTLRVVRGGSWKDRYEHLRCATRKQVAADLADDAIGFRCVRAKVR